MTKYLQPGPFTLPAGSSKISDKDWERAFGKKKRPKKAKKAGK